MAKNLERLILLLLLTFWSLAWDYQHFGEFQRTGRTKILLAGAAALAAIRFARSWHWTVGLFYFYFVANWLHFGFQPWVLPISGKQFLFETAGLEEVIGLTATLFLVPIIAERISRRLIENTILLASLVHCAIGALNLAGIYPFLATKVSPEGNLPIGLLGQQTLLGPFLAFAFVLSIIRMFEAVRGEGDPGAYAALALLNFAIALLTKSSMTYGAMAAGLAALFVFGLGLLPAIMMAALSATALLVASWFDPNIAWHSGRMEPWKDAYSLHQLRPWFGFGVGGWEPISQMIKEVRGYQFPWTYLHCEPLQTLFELGRVGVGILAAAGVALLGRLHFLYLFRDRENLTWIVGLAVFGTNSLANFTLHLVPHGPLFALCAYQIFNSRGSRG